MNKGFIATSTLIIIALTTTLVAGGTYGAYKYSETAEERDVLLKEKISGQADDRTSDISNEQEISTSTTPTDAGTSDSADLASKDKNVISNEVETIEPEIELQTSESESQKEAPIPETAAQTPESEPEIEVFVPDPEIELQTSESEPQKEAPIPETAAQIPVESDIVQECDPNGRLVRQYRDWRSDLFETEQDFEKSVEKLKEDRGFISDQSVGFEGIISNLAETAYNENRDAISAAENLNIAAGERADVLSGVIDVLEACGSTSEALEAFEENTEQYNKVVDKWNKEYGEASEAFEEFIEALESFYF